MGAPVNLAGQKFNRLIALSPFTGSSSKTRKWLCVCECGKHTSVVTNKLKSGHTKSCGCLGRESLISNARGKTHGHSKKNDATYNTWCSMRERVRESHHGAARYFERGISVCSRWESYEKFLEDMGTRPDGTTLDRINNDGNYEPGNCRWATRTIQQRNRSNTLFLVIKGEKKAAADIAEDIGVGTHVMQHACRAFRLLTAKYGDKWRLYGI